MKRCIKTDNARAPLLLSHVMINFFFDRETGFRPKYWIDIHRNLVNPEYFALADLNLFKRRLMAKHSRTTNLEKGTLPYMAPDESILTILYILRQLLLAFLIRGLAFSPHKIFTAKNKIHAPKENQYTTLWHFNGFLSHEMINFFFDRETRFRPRCWIDIHRNLANTEYFALSDLNLFKRRLMAMHNSRTGNLEKGTLPYMAPDKLMLKNL